MFSITLLKTPSPARWPATGRGRPPSRTVYAALANGAQRQVDLINAGRGACSRAGLPLLAAAALAPAAGKQPRPLQSGFLTRRAHGPRAWRQAPPPSFDQLATLRLLKKIKTLLGESLFCTVLHGFALNKCYSSRLYINIRPVRIARFAAAKCSWSRHI